LRLVAILAVDARTDYNFVPQALITILPELVPAVFDEASSFHSENAQDLQELETMIEQCQAVIAEENHTQDSDNESENSEEDSCVSGSVGLGEDLNSRVQMLLDLVPTLEATLAHLERPQTQIAHTKHESFHASGPAETYITLLRDKFPEADRRLVERLGEANWQRHINIRKRLEQIDGSAESSSTAVPTDFTAGSIFQPQTLFHDSGIGTSVPPQSCPAPSEASHASFISSLGNTEEGAATVPLTPPGVGLGEIFRCYLCGQMQLKIRDRVGWK